MPLEKVEIRPFSNDDMRIFTEMFSTYFRNDFKIEIADEKLETICQDIADYSILDISPVDILLVDATPVGFIIYQIDNKKSNWCEHEGWGFIREVYITHSMRGRGFGSTLITNAEKKLYDKGVEHIYLTSDEAGGFWRQCGYKETGEVSVTNHDPIFRK